jgi:hypothetical protein
MVLLAIVHLRATRMEFLSLKRSSAATGRSVSPAPRVLSRYRRLEEKGYVSSWMGDPTPERGGKARRHVKIEPGGARRCEKHDRRPSACGCGLDPATLRAR